MNKPVTSIQNYFGQFFQMLEPIREVLDQTLEGWDTPIIVVFGAESAGKSTILERIAMIPIFPKGEDLCTRLPIRVRLRNSQQAKKASLVVLEKKGKGGFKAVGGPGEIDLAKGEDIVRQKMNDIIEKENKTVVGISQTMQIELTLEGPDYPNLDLIDIPGLVANSKKDEPDDLKQQTHDLLDTIIGDTKGRAIYLLIRETGEKARASQSLNILKKHPFMTPWTIGVLTKCDEAVPKVILSEVDEDISDINKNQGYVATMNEPLEEFQGDLHQQAQEENEFFNVKKLRSLLESNRATTDTLVSKISELYARYLKNTWLPTTLLKIDQEILRTQEANIALGLPAICTEEDIESNKLHETLAKFSESLLQATEEEVNAIIDSFVLPLQEQITTQLKRYETPISICDFELELLVKEGSEGKVFSDLEELLHKTIKQVQDYKLKQARQKLEKDQVDVDPRTEFCVGRFPEYIDYVILQAEENDKLNYSQALSANKDYLRKEIPRLKSYDYQKKLALLSIERKDENYFFEGLTSIIMEFSVSSVLNIEALVDLAKQFSSENLIENCVEERLRLRKHEQALKDVREKLCSNFEVENSQEGLFNLLIEQNDLDGLDLRGADFSGKDLSRKSFEGAILTGVDFSGANLQEANFKEANLVEVNFQGADLRKANLEKTDLKSANFENTRLTGVKFIAVKNISLVQNLKLAGLDLQKTSFKGVDLSGQDLQGVNFKGADLQKVNLEHATLVKVNFEGANLQNANLQNASLHNANLSKVDFRNADFRNTNLQMVDFTGASSSGAKLQGASLKGCKNWPGLYWKIKEGATQKRDETGTLRISDVPSEYYSSWNTIYSNNRVVAERGWSWELQLLGSINNIIIGVTQSDANVPRYNKQDSFMYHLSNNQIHRNGSAYNSSWNVTWKDNDCLGFKLKKGKLTIYKNGKKLGVIAEKLQGEYWICIDGHRSSTTFHLRDLDTKYPLK